MVHFPILILVFAIAFFLGSIPNGVIIGKALYTGAIDLAGAVERYNE